jgi:choline dehydrogenase-like flavoprotein
MGDPGKCIRCGRCVLGCRPGVNWDSRRYLREALERGARVVSGCNVERLVLEAGHAAGVVARRGWRRRFYPADLVVLAAGGLGTPPILPASGVACEPRRFGDPVRCVAAEWTDAWQCREISMPFVVQRDRFIVSPYFDYLSFFFNPAWRYAARNTLPLMIKLADSEAGTMDGARVRKCLTAEDRASLHEGVRLCTQILGRFGVREDAVFVGTLNAGHPGGMLPLTRSSARSFHDERLPDNVYVADASLFPRSLGNPPILTIVAMAKRVSRLCRERCA